MTNIVLLFLVICYSKTIAEVLKGFHFDGDKISHPIDWWEWNQITYYDPNHPNQNWMYDFKNFGICVRIDVKPFILPMKMTACYKVNRRYVGSFTYLSFLTTLSGNSVVDDFETTT